MVSVVEEMFTNKKFPSNYTSEASENIIFAQSPTTVFSIHAHIHYGIR